MGSWWSAKVSVFAGRRTTIPGTSWTSRLEVDTERLTEQSTVPVVLFDPSYFPFFCWYLHVVSMFGDIKTHLLLFIVVHRIEKSTSYGF